MTEPTTAARVTDAVRERYAAAAASVTAATGAPSGTNQLAGQLYNKADRAALPDDAVSAALGCANPAALAALKPGETVLDLGSGGGVDVLLSARHVGPSGFVFGVDMTDEMLELAERNREQTGAENVRFLKGQIESLPLDDGLVDVVLSNCVVNLATDKTSVFTEAHRVLRPGGRLAIADIALVAPLPPRVRASLDAWTGCIAGALTIDALKASLAAAGFADASIETVRSFSRADLDTVDSTALGSLGFDDLPEDDLAATDGKIVSVSIRATKPA